ncbi:NAD(P)-dependent dehydrogenase (short-subunit alcohol dehydrogenase family) [Pseudomonas sp. SJZ103]|uniref:SDR family NAD(P)-dependent oxidoreductase n=1 Tax=unclassified Pseudomonas TaxID=196821 RepID=UPI0011A02659|nr:MULTISPECIES: SDR family NAD(P)-dependent oxidoreductase [unclassified Pseudomonas]MBB6290527.1 NAD(P)-dependent dehydrogenase (short-subunit alcohol dehydrogenase family) [Pseudomonas sp. SJZ073]MBB6315746.1 NAD(P)-dependent dehydrogenase (short-subunit alcohol dehydrogenase family) [Pseudomonas sp. JAI120]TWC63139.1 NAD(P)-dependent dehydrogenase (short-subunit alcohol dehydrogenase family) [Pseudomonas sp. SJZ103]TWC80172.1 NAD(P)-dependent dehydrogenase (short-subunit alcohol dehydrogena
MNNKYLYELFDLSGKIALVTGASSGLGRHFAAVLARAGAEVIITARRSDKLQELIEEMDLSDDQMHAIGVDVTNAASVAACFDQATLLAGVPDIIINNAGQAITKPLLEHSEADWDTVLDTNLKGAWLVASEAARHMVAAGKPGSIVNIASILGERVAGGVAPYAISKAGVLQATKAMALELARHKIRVNALMPGYVVTDLNHDFLTSEAGEKLRRGIPGRRFGKLSDLDGPLLLLASDAGVAMSGSCLAVDHAHLVSSL